MITNRSSKPDADRLADTEVVEIQRGATTEHKENIDSRSEAEYQAKLESRAEAEGILSKAKRALDEGEYELAEELAYKSIQQELATVRESKGGDGEVKETEDQAKERTLPVLTEMWSFYREIREEQGKVAVPWPEPDEPDRNEPRHDEPEPGEACPCREPPILPCTCSGITWCEMNAMFYRDKGRFWREMDRCLGHSRL